MSTGPRPRRGRPPTITPERIVQVGTELTLAGLTVKGVAEAIGVSVVALHRHIDGVEGLRRMVAESIIEGWEIPEMVGDDMATDLMALSDSLRQLVHANPGIASYLAQIDARSTVGLARIDASHAEFARVYTVSPTQAAWALSTVAEHAISLAELVHIKGGRPRGGAAAIDARPDITNLPKVKLRRGDVSEDEMYRWSMRAVVIGVLELMNELPGG